jgi:Tol biopolymer transport system component
MVWVDRAGSEQPLSAPAQVYANPRISPDGRRLAVSIAGKDGEHIWICDLPACANLTQFTKDGTTNDIPVWTADGARLAFYSNRQANIANAYWQMADGSGTPDRLTPPVLVGQHLRAWSSNGQLAAMYRANPATGPDIWILRMSDRLEFPFLATPAIEVATRFSPDGAWLAYTSTASGRAEVYVQEIPGARRMQQVSRDGGLQAIWNPKGGELFYRRGNAMMAAPITAGTSFSVGQAVTLFEAPYWQAPVQQGNPNYDVSPDGQRFLMLKEGRP